MYSIKVDKDIIIGIEQMDINLLIPHEKVVLDKKEILKKATIYKKQNLQKKTKNNMWSSKPKEK